jgi:predicted nucleic acid-binding protein
MERQSEPERLLCDTSFLQHARARRAKPDRYSHWDERILQRIDAAILAISVVTLAEARFGFLNAGWGTKKRDAEEFRLRAFLQVPISARDLDEWARLQNESKAHGLNVGQNDLWIAATATTRGHPLVTCDDDQVRLKPYLPIEVIGLRPPS